MSLIVEDRDRRAVAAVGSVGSVAAAAAAPAATPLVGVVTSTAVASGAARAARAAAVHDDELLRARRDQADVLRAVRRSNQSRDHEAPALRGVDHAHVDLDGARVVALLAVRAVASRATVVAALVARVSGLSGVSRLTAAPHLFLAAEVRDDLRLGLHRGIRNQVGRDGDVVLEEERVVGRRHDVDALDANRHLPGAGRERKVLPRVDLRVVVEAVGRAELAVLQRGGEIDLRLVPGTDLAAVRVHHELGDLRRIERGNATGDDGEAVSGENQGETQGLHGRGD